MEINYLEKAKRFLKSSATRLALTIVPLAIAAPQIKASIAVPPVDFGGQSSTPFANAVGPDGFVSGGGTGTALPILNNVIGVKLTGDWTWTANVSGGGGGIDISMGNSGFGTFASGYGIPVKWDFTITDASGDPYSWILTYSFTDTTSATGSIRYAGSGGGTQQFTGNSIIPAPVDLSSWNIDLTVTSSNYAFGDVLGVTIPNNSIDLNAADAAAPEPAALLLVGPAGAMLLLRRRKKA